MKILLLIVTQFLINVNVTLEILQRRFQGKIYLILKFVTFSIIRFESEFEVTAEQLLTNQNRLAELEKKLNEEDGKVSSLNRRLMLLEVIIS